MARQKVAAPAIVTYVVQENSDAAWQTVADWPQGVDIPFSLTGTLPEDLAARESLPYWLVAEPAEGLSYVEGSAKVYVVHASGAEDDVTSSLAVAGTNGEVSAGSFDIKAAVPSLVASDRLRLAYDMRLNDAALVGLAAGNDSYAHLEYGGEGFAASGSAVAGSHICVAGAATRLMVRAVKDALASWPDADAEGGSFSAQADARGSSLARSVSIKTSVYTYDLEVEKIAEDTGKPLAGATFALRDESGLWYRAAEKGESDPADDGWVADESDATLKTTGEDGILSFPQVDSERYELVEVKAPKGYLKVDPVDIHISTDVADGDAGVTVLGAESKAAEVVSAEAEGGTVRLRVADPADPGAVGARAGASPGLASPLARGGGLLSRTADAALSAWPALLTAVSLVLAGVLIRARRRREEDDAG